MGLSSKETDLALKGGYVKTGDGFPVKDLTVMRGNLLVGCIGASLVPSVWSWNGKIDYDDKDTALSEGLKSYFKSENDG